MCSGTGSGAAGSAGGRGAVDAGCLDPMLDRLLAVEVAGLPDSALAADLVGLRVAVSRLESEFARRLVVFDRRGAAGVTGAVSTAAWLRGACRLSAGEASERVRTARVLADDLAVSADALAGGVISYAHARVLASAAGELPAESLPTVEPILVEAARHTDPAGLRSLCTQVRTMLDPTGAEEAAALAHDRRHLSISATLAGTVVLDGVLDPEGGATVLAALMPLAAPGGADDDRTPAQRRADALVELARRALDGAALPSVGGERPHIQIRVDYATLLARTGTATLDWAGPLTPGRPCGWPAMRRSARCSPPGRARCSTWVAASGWSARPSAGRWWSVTAGASGRTVTGHRRSPTPTTSGTGSTAAPPTWPTWRWSAGAITGWCTPAGSWPTARTESGARRRRGRCQRAAPIATLR